MNNSKYMVRDEMVVKDNYQTNTKKTREIPGVGQKKEEISESSGVISN